MLLRQTKVFLLRHTAKPSIMNTSRRLVCLIVAVLGFTFFPGLAESKGATGSTATHCEISHGLDLQETPS